MPVPLHHVSHIQAISLRRSGLLGFGLGVLVCPGLDRFCLRILDRINSLGASLLEKPGHEIRLRVTAVAAEFGDTVFGSRNELSGYTVHVSDPGR